MQGKVIVVTGAFGALGHAVSARAKAVTVMYSLVSLMMIVAAVLALVAGSRPTTSNRLFASALATQLGEVRNTSVQAVRTY